MTLTAAQLQAREGRLTASRVACLMEGDPEKILHLWAEMVGEAEPDDLSSIWPVRLGEATEALNIEWFGRLTGRAVTRQGEVVIHPQADWAAATLDGFDAATPAVIECKCVGGFEARDKVVARYMPQVTWQMLCTGTRKAFLSIIEGGKEPVIAEIDLNDDYAAELWHRAEAFMAYVRDLAPPVELAPVAAPVPPDKWRKVDMGKSNAWAEHASIWLAKREDAKHFDAATKELKALVEPDVGEAAGHGVIAKRDRRGVTIKEMRR